MRVSAGLRSRVVMASAAAGSALASGEIQLIQPPLNRALAGTSAWINLVEKRDVQAPSGWTPASVDSAG